MEEHTLQPGAEDQKKPQIKKTEKLKKKITEEQSAEKEIIAAKEPSEKG